VSPLLGREISKNKKIQIAISGHEKWPLFGPNSGHTKVAANKGSLKYEEITLYDQIWQDFIGFSYLIS
jgi:hypothetical protein